MLLLVSFVANGSEEKNIAVSEKAIVSTEHLLLDSVSAKKILSGNNEDAKKIHKQALELVEQAKQAHKLGDTDATKEFLDQAKRKLFDAIRLVGNGVKKNGKKQKYTHLAKSVESLLTALAEVSVQKNDKSQTREIETFAREAITKSRTLFDNDQLGEAIELLEKAYFSVKLTIKGLRDGEILVRELNFASVEEEYYYELDRNKTHRVLVDILLTEKLKDPRFAKLMAKPLESAKKLKQQAEQQASQGDFESALRTLEQSTSQIIRAIRAAGIYIPG